MSFSHSLQLLQDQLVEDPLESFHNPASIIKNNPNIDKTIKFTNTRFNTSRKNSLWEPKKGKTRNISALADHVISTGHNIYRDHFDILATGKRDLQCKIKETLLISGLKPSLNENVSSEKLFLY